MTVKTIEQIISEVGIEQRWGQLWLALRGEQGIVAEVRLDTPGLKRLAEAIAEECARMCESAASSAQGAADIRKWFKTE